MEKNKAKQGHKIAPSAINRGGRPKGSKTKVLVPKQLLDMRQVYRTEKSGGEHPNDTPGQAIARKLCRENPQQFLVLLHKMEAEHRDRLDKQKKAEAETVTGPSEGTKEIVETIARLLAEFEESNERQ